MFTSSVRRLGLAAPPSPIPACVSSTGNRCRATHALSYRRPHQRRHSSSKPSSPADGSKGITEGQAVSVGPAQSRPDSEKKSAARTNRRKAKDVATSYMVKARDETLPNLPSVPSTHHVKGKEIAASSFFSLYRPISVTSSFPKAITEDVFAAIFKSRTKANTKTSDVISTLSSTVNKLESATQQERWNAEADELRAAITAESNQSEAETRHLDQSLAESSIPFPQHILSGDYRPFNPPPPPQPLNSAQSLAAGTKVVEAHAPQHRTYKAVLTIEESTDANGEVTYMAHSSPLVADIEEPHPSSSSDSIHDPSSTPTRFRERMNIRQERYDESLNRRNEDAAILAISVKRQRKLKMKKHKYKKLMRRTRNLRRRLDRN